MRGNVSQNPAYWQNLRMINPIGSSDWVLCTSGLGYAFSHGDRDPFQTHFLKDSLAVVLDEFETELLVLLPSKDEQYFVNKSHVTEIDIFATGKGFDRKICNVCFVLKKIEDFPVNQTDGKGKKTRRPSCKICRQDIDGRQPSKRDKAEFNRSRPAKGTLWRCPICRKLSIADVTATVRLDHDHKSGRCIGFLCDSCNTGLGRFKDDEKILSNAIAYLQEMNANR